MTTSNPSFPVIGLRELRKKSFTELLDLLEYNKTNRSYIVRVIGEWRRQYGDLAVLNAVSPKKRVEEGKEGVIVLSGEHLALVRWLRTKYKRMASAGIVTWSVTWDTLRDDSCPREAATYLRDLKLIQSWTKNKVLKGWRWVEIQKTLERWSQDVKEMA